MAEDRNAKAKREFVLKSSVARGSLALLDRFATPVNAGDHVLWRTPYDMVWEVQAVAPHLHPQVPVGTLQITLVATVPNFAVQGLVPQMSMIRVGAPARLAGDDAAPPQTDQERRDVQEEGNAEPAAVRDDSRNADQD